MGLVSSFFLMKIFTFRSRRWNQAPLENVRFCVVYAVGVVIYYNVALACANYLFAPLFSTHTAGLLSATIGAGVMMITFYFGHRVFTYRRPPVIE